MIASQTEGYAPIDLQTLMKRALHGAASKAFDMHGPKAAQVHGFFYSRAYARAYGDMITSPDYTLHRRLFERPG